MHEILVTTMSWLPLVYETAGGKKEIVACALVRAVGTRPRTPIGRKEGLLEPAHNNLRWLAARLMPYGRLSCRSRPGKDLYFRY